MRTTFQDKRRKRKEAAAQGNPELSISDPGVKRQSKALGSPPVDLNIAKPVTRKKENDSENSGIFILIISDCLSRFILECFPNSFSAS